MGGGYTHNVPLSLECPYQHMELLETIVILLSPEEYGEPIAYISLYLMWIRFFFLESEIGPIMNILRKKKHTKSPKVETNIKERTGRITENQLRALYNV